jgi:NitT/TauT family transport system substrate-binding protein
MTTLTIAGTRITRTARLLTVLACCFAILCIGRASAQTPATPAPDPKPPVKEVRLGYFANVTHAQAVLGVDSGDFAKAVAPAKLTTRIFNAGPSLIEALFAGEIDIGYVGPSPALAAHLQSRGKGIKVIAGAAGSGVVIVARPGSGIDKLEDLKGKRIATPQLGNTQDVSARHYLINVLGQPNADNVVPVPNAEQATMMSRGQIDAAWAVEPWGARLVAEAGGKIIAEEKDLWPNKNFTLTLVVVSPEFLRDHPDVVEHVLRVHADWTRRLAADPAHQVPLLAQALEKLSSKKLSEDIISAAISRVVFSTEPLSDSLTTFAKWAYDLKQARSVPDIATLVDTALLEKVLATAPKPAVPAPASAGKPDSGKP